MQPILLSFDWKTGPEEVLTAVQDTMDACPDKRASIYVLAPDGSDETYVVVSEEVLTPDQAEAVRTEWWKEQEAQA